MAKASIIAVRQAKAAEAQAEELSDIKQSVSNTLIAYGAAIDAIGTQLDAIQAQLASIVEKSESADGKKEAAKK